MKEKIQVNFKKIKELYSNRRYRALMNLGLYAIFFIVVFAILMGGSATNNSLKDADKELTTLDRFKVANNYEYYYDIERTIDAGVIYYNVEGKRYLNKEVFNIKDDINGYYVEDDIVYVTRDSIKEKLLQGPLSVDLTKIKPLNIVNLIMQAQLESTTNNYKEGTVKNSYLLPVKDFIRLYFSEIIEDKDNLFISINTYEADGNIIKVEMDLTNADKYEEFIIDFHKLELNYKSINHVEDFTISKNTNDEITE